MADALSAASPGVPAWTARTVLTPQAMGLQPPLWQRLLRGARPTYLFNPTLMEREDGYVCVCRYVEGDQRHIVAFDLNGLFEARGDTRRISESMRTMMPAVSWFADPRYFTFSGRRYLTVNNGHTVKPNDIFVVEVDPAGEPCGEMYTAVKLDGREPIEKNWAFFEAGDRLYCVYQVAPFTVLECTFANGQLQCETVSTTEWDATQYENRFGRLHGGASPVVSGGVFYNVVQSRFPESGRERVYHSTLMTFEAGPPFTPVEFSSEPLFVLAADEIGLKSSRPLNPKVRRCFYPAGALIGNDGTSLTLSYGINDYASGFRRYDIAALRKCLTRC